MRIAVAAALAVLPGCSTAVGGPTPPGEPEPVAALGFYSVEQATRGRAAFRGICSECHSTSDFRGEDFESQWRRQTVWDFYRQLTRTMPEEDPGSLSDQVYTDVIAYILQLNDYSSGVEELVASRQAMDLIPMGPGAVKTRSPLPAA
jgi:mono/diheme cytochrome c family protein